MKKLILLSLLMAGFSFVYASGIGQAANKEPKPTMSLISLNEFIKLSPREFGKRTGEKLKLKEKIGLRIYQRKLKRQMKSAPTQQQSSLGRFSLLFGVLAIACIFIPLPIFVLFSFGFAVAGLVTGIKSLKGNSNGPGILGIVLSGLIILGFFLIILVLLTQARYY